ncbi:MAG TPA: hypothetical protein VMT22_15505 [Terriglobales bacterium]|nr:hypothetical protein [Terriglobales bacterium]
MIAISIDKGWATIHFPVEDSVRRGVAKLLSQLVIKTEFHKSKSSYWQLIFLQSEANGCIYRGEDLPYSKWQWPEHTWFQEQLHRRLAAIGLSAPQIRN